MQILRHDFGGQQAQDNHVSSMQMLTTTCEFGGSRWLLSATKDFVLYEQHKACELEDL